MTKDRVQELIHNSIKGDTNSFTDLVVEFQPLVFRLAFRLLCNNEDANDIVQDVFIKVWSNLQRYDNKYSLRFISHDLKITAQSRTTNYWAFVVTILMIACSVFCLKKVW